MSLVPTIRDGDWDSVRKAIQKLSSNTRLGYQAIPTFGGANITGNVAVGGNQTITGTLGVTGATSLGALSVAGTLTLTGTLDIAGKLTAGTFASPIDVTAIREYGFEIHYSGNDYNVTGIRSRASLKTTDTTATAQGGLFQAANSDGINAGVLNGCLIEAIGKSDATVATISMMRGTLVNTEWSAKDTVTDLRILHVRTHTRNNATEGYFSNSGYGIYIENEAVGGNGQALTAGIYLKDTNISGGNYGFAYGIDFNGATISTADINLKKGVILSSTGAISFDNENLTTSGTLGAGVITGTSFIKSGGVSTEFLKANGSVDTNTYYKLYDSPTFYNLNIAAATIPKTLTLGVNGQGASAIFYSDNLGQFVKWDGDTGIFVFSGEATISSAALDSCIGSIGQWTGAAAGITTLGMSGQLTNTLAIGTSPFAVTSTTVNANLNADFLDGSHAAAFQTLLSNSAGLAAALSDETGTGLVVFNNTPTLVTPVLGVATATSMTISDLTATRIPYATTGGLLTDAAALTFDGTNVTGTGYARFDVGFGVGIASTINTLIYVNSNLGVGTGTAAISYGERLIVTNVNKGFMVASPQTIGLAFDAGWSPTALTANKTSGGGIYGCDGFAKLTTKTGETYNVYVNILQGYRAVLQVTTGNSSTGSLTVNNAYVFGALATTKTTGSGGALTPVINNLYAFYDPGQTVGTTNWGLGINTQSYINANLRIGSAVAPTVALDVTGAGLFSTTLGVTGVLTATGGITIGDAANIAVNTTTGTKFGTSTSQKIGFWNATPSVQPSGDILTALSNLGLIASPTIASFVDRGDPTAWDFKLKKEEGTATSTSANHLVDSAATFQTNGVAVNDYVHNTTDDTWAKVTVVNSEIDLTLDTDIMTSGEVYYTGSFKTDGGTYELDMSSIIPSGAKAVSFCGGINAITASQHIQIRKNGQSNWYNRFIVRTQAASVYLDINGDISCSSDRIFEYSTSNTTFADIYLAIKGWWV